MDADSSARGIDRRLAEQIGYYRAIAGEYGAGGLDLPGGEELARVLEDFHVTGNVLELACGPGTWTRQLLLHADSLTAVDASPEMLELAEATVPPGRVRFVHSDLFAWEPDRRYDVVFFGFFLSHVPTDRLAEFFSLVGRCLEPEGRVLFFDDAYRTEEELIEGARSEAIERRTGGGEAFRIIKVPHQPIVLQEHLLTLGWAIEVRATAGPFFYGAGARAR